MPEEPTISIGGEKRGLIDIERYGDTMLIRWYDLNDPAKTPRRTLFTGVKFESCKAEGGALDGFLRPVAPDITHK